MTQSDIGIVEKLKACPFCGESLIEEPETAVTYGSWRHPRNTCLMRDTIIVGDEEVAAAIAAWNTRDPIITEMVEALEWIVQVADVNLERDEKLRSQGARTLKRIADCADTLLAKVSGK